MLRRDDFVLTPLPNHLFQRDNSCWIYGGVTINPMAMPARQRETLHTKAIYTYHPMFAYAHFEAYYGNGEHDYQPATIEGGDVHVVGHGAVLIGMGERTTPMAIEMVARALFGADQATKVVAIELPHSHAFMHLDTVMSMVDVATFVLYPYFDRHLRSWTITQGELPGELNIVKNHNLWTTLAEILEVDEITVLTTDEDVRAAEREQWDDGTNFLGCSRRRHGLRAKRRDEHHAAQTRHRSARHRGRRARSRSRGPSLHDLSYRSRPGVRMTIRVSVSDQNIGLDASDIAVRAYVVNLEKETSV
jgi:arginine deiminase